MTHQKKPNWLKIKLPSGKLSLHVSDTVKRHQLNTICTSGKCPNQGECWRCGTATFMICGNICTRSCKFCNVPSGCPAPLNPNEPEEIAQSVKSLKLKHAVLTSVDRDDLPDFGAEHWARVINTVKQNCPGVTMEVLIPDFQGNCKLIEKIIETKPEVISHNLETVRRLSDSVRSRAKYTVSLEVLTRIARSGLVCKSGIMLGLGERQEEVLETMDDLRAAGCKVMTIGQYLRPSVKNIEVQEYITPETFEEYKIIGLEKGFSFVESGPLVRSSYRAERHILG